MNEVNITRSAVGRFVAVLVTVILFGAASAPHRALAQQSAKARAVSVEVVKPTTRALVRELKMPATLVADEQVDLFSKASGYVAKINVDIGSRVKKGELLVGISIPEMADDLRQTEAVLKAKKAKVRALEAKSVQAQRMVETARAQVRRYAAQHELDTINLKRGQELRKGDAITEQALDEARIAMAISEAQQHIAEAQVAGAEAEKQAVDADVEVARSDVMVAQAGQSRLKTLMEYASIRAPFDGVITIRGVDHGTFVRSAAEGTTMPLLRIAKTDVIRVVLEIPESDSQFVHIGTQVEIYVKALGEDPFPGTVSRTAGALKPETRTMRTEVDIDNRQGRFSPGMYAQVVVKLEFKAQAMMIPSKAIRVQGKDTIVLVSANGVVKSKPVEVGYDDGIWAEILSGLDGGDLVITTTSGAVAPGAAVDPVTAGS